MSAWLVACGNKLSGNRHISLFPGGFCFAVTEYLPARFHRIEMRFPQESEFMQTAIRIILYISDLLVPFLIFYVVAYGILMKRPVYDDFVRGAKDGFKTVIQIMPTLIGLMVAVGVLRASGFLDFLSRLLSRVTDLVHFPSELVPLAVVRMFSSSAATGLALDIFQKYGTDSRLGLIASIMMGCTETIFYTMSVYFMTAKVRKTRHTLAGALLATLAGIAASVILAEMMQ